MSMTNALELLQSCTKSSTLEHQMSEYLSFQYMCGMSRVISKQKEPTVAMNIESEEYGQQVGCTMLVL